MRNKRLIGARAAVLSAACVSFAALVSACSVFPESNTPTLYSLSASPGGSQDRCAASISVRDLRLPSYLDRAEIVTSRQAAQLIVSPLHLWAAPLKDELRRTVGRNLSNRWHDSRLVSHPWRYGEAPDLALDLLIEQLEPAAGKMEVQIDWQLLQPAGKPLVSGRFRRSKVIDAINSNSAAATVAAVNQSIGELSEEIAARAATTPALHAICRR